MKKNEDLLIGNDLHINTLVNNNTQWQLIKCSTEEKKIHTNYRNFIAN